MTDVIAEFQGEYRWLSNFWTAQIHREGRVYRSVEHSYMAAKSDDPAWKDYCQATVNPGDVKRASRAQTLIPEWEDRKVEVMLDCLRQKFLNPQLRALLVATGDAYIQEGNRWGDKFWGVDLRLNPPRGLNKLGLLLMQVRDEVR